MQDLFERVLLPTAPADTAMARFLGAIPALTDAVQRQQHATGQSAHARIAFEAATRAVGTHQDTIDAALASLGAHLDTHPALIALRLRFRPTFVHNTWRRIDAETAAGMPACHPNTHAAPNPIGTVAWKWQTDWATALGATGEKGKRTFHLGGPLHAHPLEGPEFQHAYTALVDLLDAFVIRTERAEGPRRCWRFRTSLHTKQARTPRPLTGSLETHQRCAEDAALTALLLNVPIQDLVDWQKTGGIITLEARATRGLPETRLVLAPMVGEAGPFFLLGAEQA
jgi:hypothetical protein